MLPDVFEVANYHRVAAAMARRLGIFHFLKKHQPRLEQVSNALLRLVSGAEEAPPISSSELGKNNMQTIYDLFPDADNHRVLAHYPDIKDDFFWETFEKCKPYTLLSIEAFYNLYCSVKYIAKYQIPGDLVECGVFLGDRWQLAGFRINCTMAFGLYY